MKKITKALVALGVGVGLVLGGALTATATPVIIDFSPESNQASWWEDYGEHKDASCYKHEGNSAHGTSSGSTVTLAEFDEGWPGDHWETLSIKAGTKVAVYSHPSHGVAYSAPEGKDVSHWIVCKGTTPSQPEPEPEPSVEYAATAECGVVSLSVTVSGTPDSWWNGIEARVGDSVIGSVALQGNGSKSTSINLPEDSFGGSATVEYYVHAATEWDIVPTDLNRQAIYPEVGDFYRTFSVESDCEPEPTPEPTPPVEEPEEPTLAETGADSTLSILGGALMLLSGAGILAYRRFTTN